MKVLHKLKSTRAGKLLIQRIGSELDWQHTRVGVWASGAGLGEMQMQNGGDLDLTNFRAAGVAYVLLLPATGPLQSV